MQVEIEGLDSPLVENVRALLGIEQSKGLAELSELRVRLLHERAPQEIRRALEPFGFYRPRIESELEAGAAGWMARYRVDAGTAMSLAEVTVEVLGEAAEDPRFRDLLRRLPLREGEALSHAHYEEAKRALLTLANQRGYFDARFEVHELEIDLDRYQAAARLRLASGRRYRFGAVRFTGGGLEDALLQRFVPFRRGEPYENARLLQLQATLRDSDYYADVRVTPLPEEAEDHLVPVAVELTERAEHRYTFGLGYGTDTGARGTLGWDWRRINPRGHSLATELAVSEIRDSISASYRIPIRDPRTDRLAFNVSLSEEDTDTSFSRLSKFGAALERARGGWREALTLDYQQELSEVAGLRERVDLILPGVTWTRVWGPERLRPRDGHRLLVDLHGGSETLGSDISFLQLRLQGKHIFGLGERWRWLGRWELGATEVAETQELPASQRFFAGGDQSVRGYAFESLGPVDALGQVVGGRNLAVGSVEIERDLGGRWSAALFFDSGYAFDDASEPVARGVGLGLRWQSPIGPIRIDLAQALDKPGEPWRVHLVIGPDL